MGACAAEPGCWATLCCLVQRAAASTGGWYLGLRQLALEATPPPAPAPPIYDPRLSPTRCPCRSPGLACCPGLLPQELLSAVRVRSGSGGSEGVAEAHAGRQAEAPAEVDALGQVAPPAPARQASKEGLKSQHASWLTTLGWRQLLSHSCVATCCQRQPCPPQQRPPHMPGFTALSVLLTRFRPTVELLC